MELNQKHAHSIRPESYVALIDSLEAVNAANCMIQEDIAAYIDELEGELDFVKEESNRLYSQISELQCIVNVQAQTIADFQKYTGYMIAPLKIVEADDTIVPLDEPSTPELVAQVLAADDQG